MLKGTGIIISSKLIERTFSTEQILTTNDFVTIRPLKGNFDVSKLLDYNIIIKNTGINDALVTILGSVDGDTFDIILHNSIRLNANNYLLINQSYLLKIIYVEAKSRLVNQSTTIISKGYGIGGE